VLGVDHLDERVARREVAVEVPIPTPARRAISSNGAPILREDLAAGIEQLLAIPFGVAAGIALQYQKRRSSFLVAPPPPQPMTVTSKTSARASPAARCASAWLLLSVSSPGLRVAPSSGFPAG
jgi:hypothetical protein